MGKQKSELEDRIEELEEEIKQLKVTNNSLRRRLKKLDNSFREDEYLNEDEIEKKYERLTQYNCPDCKKNSMEEIEIAGRMFRKCVDCGKRTKAKKV